MSTGPGSPASGHDDYTTRVLAVLQLVEGLYAEWCRVETLREERARLEVDLRRDDAKLKAQLSAFRKTLAAQIRLEEARATAFVTTLQAISPVQDPQVAAKLLEAAAVLIRTPIALPILLADSPREG